MTPRTDRTAISILLSGLLDAGWAFDRVDYFDGDVERPGNLDEAMDMIMSVDQSMVVMHFGGRTGWLFFVLGNAPIEVLADHSVNMESFVRPIVDPWWELG